MNKILFLSLSMFFLFSTDSQAKDCWLSISGAGLKNGQDVLNAFPASKAQTCWDQTSPNGIMHILTGEYSVENGTFWQLKIDSKNDGSQAGKNNFKKLMGEGKVVLRGARKIPYESSMREQGGEWIHISENASHLSIQNFTVTRLAEGITASEGGNRHLRFQDLHFEDTRQNLVIAGHPDCTSRKSCRVNSDKLSQDILIQNTWGNRYSKRHVRLSHGVSQVRVINSHADAEFQDGDFAVGFDVENSSHDIEFNHCTSRNNVYTISPYWNGDGFKSEGETEKIRWINCSAFDNGDAGFDIKTKKAYLENIIALRNKRNIRIWSSQKATVKNANASYSQARGGAGSAAGIWSSGSVDCQFCTLHDNPVQVMAENNGKGAKIRLYDSVLSTSTQDHRNLIQKEKGTHVDLIRTTQLKAGVNA